MLDMVTADGLLVRNRIPPTTLREQKINMYSHPRIPGLPCLMRTKMAGMDKTAKMANSAVVSAVIVGEWGAAGF